jgi:predicted kinase
LKEIVIFIGPQATGKSSFYIERFYRTHVRVNLDMLRARARESRLIAACLDAGQSFVVDNTNPSPVDRARYIPAARAAGFRVIGYHFIATLAEALRRNGLRPAQQRIPEAAVRATFARLTPPSLDEGFDAIFRVRLDDRGLSIE